jgi:transposase
MKKDITSLFCFVDDFVQGIQEEIKSYCLASCSRARNPTRQPGLSESEIITILLLFQDSPCRNLKYFYQSYLHLYNKDFPKMPSYERFISLMPRVLDLLTLLLYSLLSPGQGMGYVDSTSLAVCHPKRIKRNRVFQGLAKLGKTTKGWFFGLKLHLIVDDKGNLMRVKLTPGNVDDRCVVDPMTKGMIGVLFGDKGYLGQNLFHRLYQRGLKLVTGVKKKMKNILMPWHEKILLRKRSLIETVFDFLKNKQQLEHTRHRSGVNAFIHILTTLIAYQLKPTKPSISYNFESTNP